MTRRAGTGWLLVGDAAGFLDPFTGEGLHRALVSSELAAAAIAAHVRGRPGAFDAYERAMQRRFLAKDVVSWLVQGSSGGRRCSTTPPGGSPRAHRSVRRWVS